jgi:5-formyltetrahydrofolate cyclo-ligase
VFEKKSLRSRLIAARSRIAPDERSRLSIAIAARADEVPAVRAARTLAAYAALGAEVDCSEVARRAAERGATIVYPRAAPGERVLVFARAEPGELVVGPFGALEPPAGAREVPLDDVDCVVLPGVAFSEDGFRLGRGGGYYDATLERMPHAACVGLAFDAQVVPSLPREPHDVSLDAIVTETRVLLFAPESR